MFLKRVELTGFKSFANKTELEFVDGISAVVGPNGSGKSNISDAIRWVLGEQSARSLRGGKMEDIIFAGSDARNAVNFSEVSLTLDNTDEMLPLDFNEITVTRRLHRNGDSEYFINKQACRLRDITELFMDTGIGKEAYSIIGQGRIEEILSTRSEDRRGIFEEASGIVKFKSRKKEAQKKLDQTEQNLLRIHDLTSELEDQIEPLQMQSEKAKEFKQLKEQLTSQEISLTVYQIEQVHQNWQAENERCAELKDQQLQLSTIVNQHDAHLETYRSKMKQSEDALEQLQQQLLTYSEQVEKCEGQAEVLKERQRNLQQSLLEREEAVKQGEQRLAEHQAEQAQLQEKREQVAGELERIQRRLADEEQQLSTIAEGAASEAEERLKGELLESLNQAAQARNELRYIAQQLEDVERKKNKSNEDRQRWLAEQVTIEEQQAQLKEQIEQVTSELTQIRDQYVAKTEGLKQSQRLSDETQILLRKTEHQLDSLVSRRDTMLELQNDYDGFVHGVREVLKASKRNVLQGVHGAVAELIKVPAKVELAMETALGAALQHIVMENEAYSREAIQYLKKKQYGRATFLPMDVLKGRFIAEQEKQQAQAAAGFVGVAVDLVEFDAQYQAVMANLLGNVMIAETLEQANRIAAACKYRYRVVTLDGDVVHAGGSMSGGSQHKKNVSLLGRQRQIAEMELQITEIRSRMNEIHERAAVLKDEILQVTGELEQLRQQGEQKRLHEQQLHAEHSSLANELEQIKAQLQLFEEDQSQLAEEQKINEDRMQTLTQRVTELQQEEASLQQAIQAAELERKAHESKKEQLQGQLTDLKVQAAAVSQEKHALDEQLRRQAFTLQQLNEEQIQRIQLKNQTEQDLQLNQQQQVAQVELLNDLQIKRQTSAEQIEFARAERAEWTAQLESEENETRDQRIELRKVEERLHQSEVKVNRLDVELENLLKKLAEDYELSIELAKQRYATPDDVPAAEQAVKELKRKISALGEVNLGAIEEYERVSERFSFLSQQKQDLLEAKQTLYNVIHEMEAEMSKMFQQTFEEIRAQFSIAFGKLFGGGRADLILSEPGQLLDTGIEIVAQPPGKKLQNLQLLSGGERALTAIALLFAILNVKPVPFCVLDEVEAALDEANVSRFARYLRDFSENTQFIVVTHRKGTMEEADVLYGVTMEEDGISKLVSVKLEDEEAVSA